MPGSAEAGVIGVMGAGVAGFCMVCSAGMVEDEELIDVKDGML